MRCSTPEAPRKTYTVRDDVGVTLQRSLGVTVLGLIAGEVPDNQSLVSAGGEEHVVAGGEVSRSVPRVSQARSMAALDILLHRGGQAGDPAILQTLVSIQSTRSGFSFGARGRHERAHQHAHVCADGHKTEGRGRRTWPSRVPLRINCSAIATVTR